MTNETPDDLNAMEQSWKKELSTFYTELKYMHARRKKHPLKFVEFFEMVEKRLPSFANSGWESVEKELGYVKNLLNRFRPDYVASFGPASRQASRNVFWEGFYTSPRILEGGRADGNS